MNYALISPAAALPAFPFSALAATRSDEPADRQLIELGEQFDRALADYEPFEKIYMHGQRERLQPLIDAIPEGLKGDGFRLAYERAWEESGMNAIEDEHSRLIGIVDGSATAIAKATASTVAGFAVKARALWWYFGILVSSVQFDLMGYEDDLLQFFAELERCATGTSMWADRMPKALAESVDERRATHLRQNQVVWAAGEYQQKRLARIGCGPSEFSARNADFMKAHQKLISAAIDL